jgi:GNAT superfamily N-acetyltransferase
VADAHPLRRLTPADLVQVLSVYRDAVLHLARDHYTPIQIEAWSSFPGRSGEVRAALARGYGLASCAAGDSGTIEAFGLLDPIDRLSLLYCRARSGRQGRGAALLRALEAEARRRRCRRLRTEASRLSRPLLERHGWWVEAEEEVIFAGAGFRRWRMIKDLSAPREAEHGSHGGRTAAAFSGQGPPAQ